MKKKGISPLIATVLIIGFTVALAALILNWGQTFTQDIQDSTSESGEQQLTCATDVVFDLQSACNFGANTLLVTIANNGALDIEDFSVRIYEDENKVYTISMTDLAYTAPVVEAFGIQSFQLDLTGSVPTIAALDVTKIEVIPQVIVGEEIISCTATIEDLGTFGTTFDIC